VVDIYYLWSLFSISWTIDIFLTIIRRIEFSNLKSQKWLTSILAGFFSSILLTQPLKVLSLAIFFTFTCRHKNEDQEAGELWFFVVFSTKAESKLEYKTIFGILVRRRIRQHQNQVQVAQKMFLRINLTDCRTFSKIIIFHIRDDRINLLDFSHNRSRFSCSSMRCVARNPNRVLQFTFSQFFVFY
jgi:hypothetical protein